jgi:hypothetical protein
MYLPQTEKEMGSLLDFAPSSRSCDFPRVVPVQFGLSPLMISKSTPN